MMSRVDEVYSSVYFKQDPKLSSGHWINKLAKQQEEIRQKVQADAIALGLSRKDAVVKGINAGKALYTRAHFHTQEDMDKVLARDPLSEPVEESKI